MNRRKFFKDGSLTLLGASLLGQYLHEPDGFLENGTGGRHKKAKNIIFMVSDGMSAGTLAMADQYLSRRNGTGSNWLQLYRDSRVARAVMDTASANSIVTDSSAGSSSWGGGFRVNNGSLNVAPSGEHHLPIWQKFKLRGKKAGCVTTVPVTHATPAGFCVSTASRNDQEVIASLYLDKDFDVLLGGGRRYFDAASRNDKVDVIAAYRQKGYTVVRSRAEMAKALGNGQLLGLFADDSLPFSADRHSSSELSATVPTLSEMTSKAISVMQGHPGGFVLQVEAGKVDWGAHANDIAAILHDQIAFDEAVKTAIDFAERDGETLVIMTSDHGNANPGLIYGEQANQNFDRIQEFKKTNEWILNQIHAGSSTEQVREIVMSAHNITLETEQAKLLLGYYDGLYKEEGLYNYKKLPFRAYAEILKPKTSVGWISMEHSADYTEVAAFGPGSHLLKPFVRNTDLHYLMLEAAAVENKF